MQLTPQKLSNFAKYSQDKFSGYHRKMINNNESYVRIYTSKTGGKLNQSEMGAAIHSYWDSLKVRPDKMLIPEVHAGHRKEIAETFKLEVEVAKIRLDSIQLMRHV